MSSKTIWISMSERSKGFSPVQMIFILLFSASLSPPYPVFLFINFQLLTYIKWPLQNNLLGYWKHYGVNHPLGYEKGTYCVGYLDRALFYFIFFLFWIKYVNGVLHWKGNELPLKNELKIKLEINQCSFIQMGC